MEFKILKNTTEAVLIEVVFEDAVDKMSQKGFTGKEKFIKFTKGKNRSITLYDESNKGFCSFRFGESGSTLVSDELHTLRAKIERYVLSRHIQVRKMTEEIETELKIMPPKSGLGMKDHFCVHLGGDFAIFLETEEEIRELFGEYEVYHSNVAVTGVTVLRAKLNDKNKVKAAVY